MEERVESSRRRCQSGGKGRVEVERRGNKTGSEVREEVESLCDSSKLAEI